jgi:hypothetical protein
MKKWSLELTLQKMKIVQIGWSKMALTTHLEKKHSNFKREVVLIPIEGNLTPRKEGLIPG